MIQWILIIATSIGIIPLAMLAVISAIDPAFLIGETQHQIEVGSIVFTLAEGYTPDNDSLLIYLGILFLLGALCVAGMCYAIGCFQRILQSVCQGNPFYPTVGRDIRKIGFVCIGVGIVDNIAQLLEAHNMLQNLGLLALMGYGPITYISVRYNFDLTFLIVFFVLFDNARNYNVEEIYATLFEDKRENVIALEQLMEQWGFRRLGYKENSELVLVKSMNQYDFTKDPKFNFPLIIDQPR